MLKHGKRIIKTGGIDEIYAPCFCTTNHDKINDFSKQNNATNHSSGTLYAHCQTGEHSAKDQEVRQNSHHKPHDEQELPLFFGVLILHVDKPEDDSHKRNENCQHDENEHRIFVDAAAGFGFGFGFVIVPNHLSTPCSKNGEKRNILRPSPKSTAEWVARKNNRRRFALKFQNIFEIFLRRFRLPEHTDRH